MKRLIKGKIEKFIGMPWANLPIKFELNQGSYQSNPPINYPSDEDTVTTDETGSFEIYLWCNEIGGKPSVYKCYFGEDDPFIFTVPGGVETLDITNLREWGSQPFPSPVPNKPEIREIFVPTSGQINFSLQISPKYPHLSRVFLNGVKAVFPVDYVIDGSLLTWLSAIRLENTDFFEVIY